MGIKVIYSDLDGTMVGPRGCFVRAADGSPTLEPAEALVDLHRAGISLVLVSGRTHAQLGEAARIFGADGFVGELGAVLGWDHGRAHQLQRGAMPEHLRGTLIEELTASGLLAELFAAFPGQLDFHAPWHLGHEADLLLSGGVDVATVEAWLADHDHGWLRLHDNGRLPRYAGTAAHGGPLHVYHLMAAGITKGTGVAADLARRGLSADQAVAIGDSRSDLTMLAHVRQFFLTANGAHAADDLAAAARSTLHVCAQENGLGWVEAVRWALAAA